MSFLPGVIQLEFPLLPEASTQTLRPIILLQFRLIMIVKGRLPTIEDLSTFVEP